eukprot:7303469-Pyramimonas_sp.AAC.1
MAEAAVDASRQKPVREAWCMLSRAWATFAHAAEMEVSAVTGQSAPSSASWGAPPKARWVDCNHRPET